jgi:DNA-binding response OmpR family regulator
MALAFDHHGRLNLYYRRRRVLCNGNGLLSARAAHGALRRRGCAIRPGKQRAVLAALLLNAGRVVSVDELTEVLWGLARRDRPGWSSRTT